MNNIFLNGARFVYFKSAAPTSVLEGAAAKAKVETPQTPAVPEVPKAQEVAKITADTKEAAAKVTKSDSEAVTPETNEAKAKAKANSGDTNQTQPDSVKEAPLDEAAAPVHNRSMLAKILIWPYWAVTQGATKWAMGGEVGRYLDKKGRQLDVIDDGIMELANFPWGPVKLPYWLVTRILGVVGKGTTTVLSAPGRLLPNVNNPFPSEK